MEEDSEGYEILGYHRYQGASEELKAHLGYYPTHFWDYVNRESLEKCREDRHPPMGAPIGDIAVCQGQASYVAKTGAARQG